MYSNSLVVAIKKNGSILREDQNKIYIPFNSEYSILIKNLKSVRAQVKIFIDGEDMTDQTFLIIPANGSIEVERSIKNTNRDKGNRFKFIEKTSVISNYRGNKIEDGLVRIEYQFEQPYQYYWNNYISNWQNSRHVPDKDIWPNNGITYGGCINTSSVSTISANSHEQTRCINNISVAMNTNIENTSGVTVPGSISDQKFVPTSSLVLESNKYTMVFQLMGEVNNKQVTSPITVKSKPKCVSCGRINRATHKFCSQCGTGLEII